METPKVFESEYRFCLILWENEPINSTKLAKLCNEKLGWSRTTTYTVIRRLSERGVVKNENATVTSLVSKDEVQAAEIDELVEKTLKAPRRHSSPLSRDERNCPGKRWRKSGRCWISMNDAGLVRRTLDQYECCKIGTKDAEGCGRCAIDGYGTGNRRRRVWKIFF